MHGTSKETCRIVRAGAAFTGLQGLDYRAAISAETVGSRGIHMQLVNIPPGARAKAHRHESHESAVYVLSGRAAMWFGDGLADHMEMAEGDFVYIPANVPHLPYNPSSDVACTAVIARTDPNEQESVVLMPELDSAVPKR